jgi:hypothetical protein
MADVRATVRRLERRAYRISQVYRHTPGIRVGLTASPGNDSTPADAYHATPTTVDAPKRKEVASLVPGSRGRSRDPGRVPPRASAATPRLGGVTATPL